MKRLAVILAALIISAMASAQSHFGVLGGLSFSNAPRVAELDLRTATLYHAGLTYQYKFTQGFSVQPSVLFMMKGANNGDKTAAVREGSMEIPVAFQWGPDLLLFRPFVEVVPYIGFNIPKLATPTLDPASVNGGVGIGGGLEIWKIQLSARYNWNFNPYRKTEAGTDPAWAFRCTTLSLAFLF